MRASRLLSTLTLALLSIAAMADEALPAQPVRYHIVIQEQGVPTVAQDITLALGGAAVQMGHQVPHPFTQSLTETITDARVLDAAQRKSPCVAGLIAARFGEKGADGAYHKQESTESVYRTGVALSLLQGPEGVLLSATHTVKDTSTVQKPGTWITPSLHGVQFRQYVKVSAGETQQVVVDKDLTVAITRST